ncbi:metal ABC transporter solute-binding protein, Zn/Mn family [Pontibacillus marinus]|uniref:ABC transporter substrate-binding protein n=1 Tax=Pontibacillus marinus BH030004 = DSM 16465 TaxID=1385511 RepID=A0A0A5HLV3_9BACI|nr:zinc ABC transporter substrate-binding protein [Pontibacillus marinus]KGX84602.1 ABC transporter substrate-binding protein [Pontibacillus marinus BH030004 = DSM 16465]
MKLLQILTVLSLILIVGCSGDNQVSSNDSKEDSNTSSTTSELQIYTTLFPLKDFTEKIGGNHVEVDSILPAGSDPHTFEPTAKMMVRIAEADAFIYNGGGIETYAEKISESLKDEKVKIIEAAKEVKYLSHSNSEHEEEHEESHEDHAHEEEHGKGHEDHAHEEEHGKGHEDHAHEEVHGDEEDHASEEEHSHDHGDKDPHVWLDPIRAIQLAENIKNELVELKPEAKKDFEQNFEELKATLEELDQEFRQTLETTENNKILVSHAAYGYWEESYGIKQIAISGLSSTNEPSQKELERIIKKSEKYNLKYILFEQNVTPKVAKVIQNQIGAEALQLHNISVLTEEERKENEDYFSLMRKNLDVLEKVLE